MAEEMKKDSMQLDLDELGQVTGGTGAGEWISRLFQPEEEAAVAYKKTWSEIMAKSPEGSQGAADMAGAATQKAYCPVCGAETEFSVFSGARGICKRCGNMRQDL